MNFSKAMFVCFICASIFPITSCDTDSGTSDKTDSGPGGDTDSGTGGDTDNRHLSVD